MNLQPQAVQSRSRVAALLIVALALLMPMMFGSAPASANETEPGNWVLRSLGQVSDMPRELSGLTITSDGAIYGVDDDGGNVYCLANYGTETVPNWKATVVTGLGSVFQAGDDMEGIASDGEELIIALEKGDADRISRLQYVTVDGTQGTPGFLVALPEIEDLNNEDDEDEHGGGVEGITAISAEENFMMVEEGKLVLDDDGEEIAVPMMHRVEVDGPGYPSQALRSSFVLLPVDSNGELVNTDAAGVAVEPRGGPHAYVVSEQTKELRKFGLFGDDAGKQMGGSLSLNEMQQPEAIAFTGDGIHMLIGGEGSSSSEIAVYSQAGSLAPLPTGNCTGDFTICSGASVSATPNPVIEGEAIEATVTTGSCGNEVILETRVTMWNFANIDWDSKNASFPGPLDSATFTGIPTVVGTETLSATVYHDIQVYTEDGTQLGYQTIRQDVSVPLTVQAQTCPNGDMGSQLVQMQNVRWNTFLDGTGSGVQVIHADTPEVWSLDLLPNCNVHIINYNDGTYLDLDLVGSNNRSVVQTKATAEEGTEWTLTTTSRGRTIFTNADLTAENANSLHRLRTHRYNRAYTSKWSGSYAQWNLIPFSDT